MKVHNLLMILKKKLLTLIEVLKFLQKNFVKGRPLDVIDINTALEEATNYIRVDGQKHFAVYICRIGVKLSCRF